MEHLPKSKMMVFPIFHGVHGCQVMAEGINFKGKESERTKG
jgi:hypothetical protein